MSGDPAEAKNEEDAMNQKGGMWMGNRACSKHWSIVISKEKLTEEQMDKFQDKVEKCIKDKKIVRPVNTVRKDGQLSYSWQSKDGHNQLLEAAKNFDNDSDLQIRYKEEMCI